MWGTGSPRQRLAKVLPKDAAHGQVLEKLPHTGDDVRDGLRPVAFEPDHVRAQVGGLQLRQRLHTPRAQKVQELAKLRGTGVNRQRAEVTVLDAVGFVVPQRLPHRRRDVELAPVDSGAFDAPVAAKVAEYLDAVRRVASPAARRVLVGAAVLDERRRKVLRKLVAELPLFGEADEMAPGRPVPRQRLPAVADVLQVAERTWNKAL